MKLFFNKNSIILACFLSLIFNLNYIFSVGKPTHSSEIKKEHNEYGIGERFLGGYKRSGSLDWLYSRQELRKELDNLLRTRKDIENGSSDNKEESLKELDLDIANVRSLLKGSFGDVFFRGIAGEKNFNMVKDLRVGNDVLKGTLYGVGLRGAVSVGNTIGSRIDNYSTTILGGILGGFENYFKRLWRFIFHRNCKPFTTEEIKSWQTIVTKDLRNIENMLRTYDRLDSRGRAEILKENQDEDKKKDISLWQDFVEDYALTCQELIEEIQRRVNYYEKKQTGYGIKNCANRLINKLNKIKNWLIKCKTLKDFLNVPEVKSILPAMRDSLDAYFNNLVVLLDPWDQKNKNLANTASVARNNYNNMDDGPYPMAMGF
ncbi:hypothetical protein K9L05_03420 [Candidatus Babeliales bacterium]|nr:hypothetical protein [Candidatus Babeliales bacterium]